MISILMPVYNGIEFMDTSVTSILEQTHKEWELLIGINGHPPGSTVYQTAKAYEKDPRIRVLDLTTKGKSNTLNEMLSYCSYSWIALLDVDDVWLPLKLETQLSFMSLYDVIGTHCHYFGERYGQPDIPTGDLRTHDFMKVNPIINSSCLVKKEHCLWDGSVDGVEDYDMWLRVWRKKCYFYNVPEALVLHRIHQSSSFNAKGNHVQARDVVERYR
jgi:teichuronic acid biosynthesis glycosyltransferase TuaG